MTVTRKDEIWNNILPYPANVQSGTGTTGTALTYDRPFSEKPVVVIIPTSSPATNVILKTESASGFTATASGIVTFNYIALGLSE